MSSEQSSAVGANTGIFSAIKRLARQPSFLVAFGVLLLAAVSLNAATQFLQLHFKKLPVPLAHKLEGIPMNFGSWVCVSQDQLNDDMQQELGTETYIMRYYVNSTEVSVSDLAAFEGKDNRQRLVELNKLKERYRRGPQKIERAIMSFAVTYYTGKADTVAHIPERCYTADGYEPTEIQTEDWDLKTAQWSQAHQPVRYISFEDQAGTARVRKNVAYFFHANGQYRSDPKMVRLALQALRQRHAYYAKVELMMEGDREPAAVAMKDFLVQALPEVEKCLPDWGSYQSK